MQPVRLHTQPSHASHMVSFTPLCLQPIITSNQPSVLMIYRTQSKHLLNSFPSYITDLFHLKKISCCSNHSASPHPPLLLPIRSATVLVVINLPCPPSKLSSLSFHTALVVCLTQVQPSTPTLAHLHGFITREQSPSNRH